MKSMMLMALLAVALAAEAQPPQPSVADVLLTASEQLQPLIVAEHDLAEMRSGFPGRKDISDEESSHVDDVLAISEAFSKSLDPVFVVGGLVAQMRLPEDADAVRRKLYFMAANMVSTADSCIARVNRSMAAMHNSAAKAQATRVRDAMAALRDSLQALPK